MSIASSLRKAGYLSIGAEGLGKFLKKMRENQQEEELAKASTETYKKLKELFAPEPQFEEPRQTSITALSKEGIKQEIPIEEPSIQIMPDYIPPQERLSRGKNLMADYIEKISSIKGIDPERIQKEFSFMQERSKLLQPEIKKPEIKQFNPKYRTVKISDDGSIETLFEPEVSNTTEESDRKIGEYVGADGYKRFVFLDKNGSIKELKSNEKTRSDNINIRMPKPEKWTDVGNVLNMIDYTYNEQGQVVLRSEEEKAKYRLIGLNFAKSILLPEALNWHNTEIAQKWGREDLPFEDYNYEIKQSLQRGEISVDAAQDLIDFNVYRAKILNTYDKEPYYLNKILGKENKTEGKK